MSDSWLVQSPVLDIAVASHVGRASLSLCGFMCKYGLLYPKIKPRVYKCNIRFCSCAMIVFVVFNIRITCICNIYLCRKHITLSDMSLINNILHNAFYWDTLIMSTTLVTAMRNIQFLYYHFI